MDMNAKRHGLAWVAIAMTPFAKLVSDKDGIKVTKTEVLAGDDD